MLTETRLVGRGGLGQVAGSKMLAFAGYLEGYNVQAIPKYGAERRGAPVDAYMRISSEEIKTHAPVLNPDVLLILDTSLIGMTVDLQKQKEGVKVILNSREIPESYKSTKITLGCVDATKIAREEGLVRSGFVMVNTTMLGAWIKATGLIKLENLIEAVKHSYKGSIAEKNIKAIERAYIEYKEA